VSWITDVSSIAAGETSSIALKSDGTVWRLSANGDPVDLDYYATDVAMGHDYGLAILSNIRFNTPPVAVSDAYNIDEDNWLIISTEEGVISNDIDPDAIDVLQAVLVEEPSNGLLTLSSDGSFSYQPEPDFFGTDTFEYKAYDGEAYSNVVSVTITIQPVNDAPEALADGPFLGLEGYSVLMDASASSDKEGDPLAFIWDFGDGTTFTTIESSVEHTYANVGTYVVTLIVNDGGLDSIPFLTEADIGFTGGGQRDDVDAFLAYFNPTEKQVSLPVGTTSFVVEILYGSTIDSLTFQASLNGALVSIFNPIAGMSETVNIPLTTGRNTLVLSVDGVRSDGRTATDRDRLVFIVAK
jgi:hypothetical protein